jgi:GTP-binding protein Era
MLDEEKTYRVGYVAVVGRPNALLGQKVAAVSPRAQTTRRRQLGILTLENAQIVFVDTPGMHNPHHRLGEYMNEVAYQALEDADVILWLVDVSEGPTEEDRQIAKRLSELRGRTTKLLGLNKIDRVLPDKLEEQAKIYQELLPKAQLLRISAVKGIGHAELLQAVIAHLGHGDPFFAEDQVTDLFEREIAVDLIREAALVHLEDEVPHCVAVRMDEFTDRRDDLAYIGATLLVERDSQKGIVIGKGGEMIKRISSSARQSIQLMLGRQVFLELRVKVSPNWRDDPNALRWLGFVKEK